MRRTMLGLAVSLAIAGVAGCSVEQGVQATVDSQGQVAGVAKAPALPARPKAMSAQARLDALAIELVAAAPIEGDKNDRWKVVARLKNATDIDIEGVEVRAAIYPPGTLAPIGMHAREVFFKNKLSYLEEQLIELDFATSKSDANPEDRRQEVTIAALVSPPVPEAKWQVLNEAQLEMVRESQPRPPADPKAEMAKLREDLASRTPVEPQSAEGTTRPGSSADNKRG